MNACITCFPAAVTAVRVCCCMLRHTVTG
jgi:hypothetical protein